MKRKYNIPHKYYSSLFFRFLLFHIIVFLVPFSLLIFFIFNINTAIIYEEQERIIVENESRLSTSLENSLKEADRISYSLTFHPYIIPNLMESNVNRSQECIRAINNYLSKNAIYNDIIVYFPSITSNLVYTSTGSEGISILDTYLPLSNADDSKNYVESIKEIKKPLIIPVTNKMDVKDTNDLVYVNPVYFSRNNWYMTVFFLLNGSDINNMSSRIINDLSGMVYIFNRSNRLIYSYGSDIKIDNAPAEFLKDNQKQGIYELTLENFNYVVSSSTLYNGDLRIITAIPETEFDLHIAKRQTVLRQITLVVAVVGILIIIFFTFQTYIPIYRLNKAIQNDEMYTGEKRNNELVNINNILLNTIDENQSIKYIMKDVTERVRQQLLLMLLNGNINNNNAKILYDLMAVSQINLPGPHYNVMCLFLPQKITPYVRSEIAKSIRQNVIWHPGSIYAFPIEQVSSIAIIASLGPGPDIRIFQDRLAATIHDILSVRFDLEGTVCAGKVYDNILNINKFYIEASAMLEGYGDMPRKTAFFNEVVDAALDHNSLIQDYKTYLLQSIKKGNKGMALESLHAVIDEIHMTLTTAMINYKIASLITDISGTLVQIGFWEQNQIDTLVEPLTSHISSPKVKTLLSDIILNACIYSKTGNQKQTTDVVDDVRNYIDVNFQDSSLNLNQIADNFNISPFHLSREFKKFVGMNFIEYVSFLRINEAKKLLAKTDIKVKNIVDKIGYNDTSNFIRKFRISEGITPGQYRKSFPSGAVEDTKAIKRIGSDR